METETPKKRGRKPKAATEKKPAKTPLKEARKNNETESIVKKAATTRSKLENKFLEAKKTTDEPKIVEKVLTRAQRAKLLRNN